MANQRLVTDGVTVFLEEHEDVVRLRDRQVTIAEVFREHLKPLEYDGDAYPEATTSRGCPACRSTHWSTLAE